MRTTGAVVLFDLDHFRHINTALDTAGGNQVLIEVARRLESFVPNGAITARTGSDEFAIFCRVPNRSMLGSLLQDWCARSVGQWWQDRSL